MSLSYTDVNFVSRDNHSSARCVRRIYKLLPGNRTLGPTGKALTPPFTQYKVHCWCDKSREFQSFWNSENRTPDCWVKSVNATSVLCSPQMTLCVRKQDSNLFTASTPQAARLRRRRWRKLTFCFFQKKSRLKVSFEVKSKPSFVRFDYSTNSPFSFKYHVTYSWTQWPNNFLEEILNNSEQTCFFIVVYQWLLASYISSKIELLFCLPCRFLLKL